MRLEVPGAHQHPHHGVCDVVGVHDLYCFCYHHCYYCCPCFLFVYNYGALVWHDRPHHWTLFLHYYGCLEQLDQPCSLLILRPCLRFVGVYLAVHPVVHLAVDFAVQVCFLDGVALDHDYGSILGGE